MMKKLVFFLLLSGSKIFCQSYSFPETFNQAYNFKPELACEELSKTAEAKANPANFEAYAVNSIYQTQFEFDNNEVYMDWPEAEAYMIKLLDTIIPKDFRKKNLDIYLARDVSPNATTSRYGMILFNIGRLATAEDEAEVAGVIAHEAAHYIFKHHINIATYTEQLFKSNKNDWQAYQALYQQMQKEEMQADSFSLACLKRAGYSVSEMEHRHEMRDMKQRIYRYSISYKNLMKTSSMPEADFEKYKQKTKGSNSTHPSHAERMDKARKAKAACTQCNRKYIVDSTLFVKYKRVALEECKNITFDNSSYAQCLRLCFIDYLYRPKNLKNLYLICECIRRMMYANPELSGKGFLAENINDVDLLSFNYSILHKPDYIFDDYKQYMECVDHPFFKKEIKPFNTYNEAFHFFSFEALALKMNEVNFSVGLYYLKAGHTDSIKKYLTAYTSSDGINHEMAESILKNGKPVLPEGKLFVVYNNIGNYTGRNMNYYLTLQRKRYNSVARKILSPDTVRTELMLVNELLGKNPAELYEYQKLENAIAALYNETDVEVFKKPRLSSHETMEQVDLKRKANKNLVLFAPEWYRWMKQKRASKLFDVEVSYQYDAYMKEEEYANTYVGAYLDINSPRPYFKDAVRNGFVRKEKEEDILKALDNFLYGKE